MNTRQPGEMPPPSAGTPNLTSADPTDSPLTRLRDELRSITAKQWLRAIIIIGALVAFVVSVRWAGDGRLWGYKQISPEEARQFIGR